MNIKKIVSLTFALALLLTGCGNGSNPSSIIKSSDRKIAPKLSGVTLDGGTYEVQPGKVTVINVWASWCAPCRAEVPLLVDFAGKNPDIQFVGILTRDNISAAAAFSKRFKMNYPTFVDDALINKFQGSIPANGIPTSIIIDKSGRVAARISGATTVGNFKRIIEKISGKEINA